MLLPAVVRRQWWHLGELCRRHRSWAAVVTRTRFFVSGDFLGLPRCRTSPFPSSILEAPPVGFGLPRLQMMGGYFAFVSGKKQIYVNTFWHNSTRYVVGDCVNW